MPFGEAPFAANPLGSAGLPFLNAYPCDGETADMMNTSVAVWRKVESRSSATAGLVPTWVEHISSVCAALQVDSASETQQGFRETGETRLRLYAPSGVDIKPVDKIVPNGGIYAGQEFHVESTQADDAGYAAYGKWRVRRAEGGGVR